MNSIMKKAFKEHLCKLQKEQSVKITYIRDTYGYKCGVAIKIGKGKNAKIGWSLVSPQEKVCLPVKPHQTPTWQFMVKEGIPLNIILSHSFYHKLLENHLFIDVPLFDRYEGLSTALNYALYNNRNASGNVQSLTQTGDKAQDISNIVNNVSKVFYKNELIAVLREMVSE